MDIWWIVESNTWGIWKLICISKNFDSISKVFCMYLEGIWKVFEWFLDGNFGNVRNNLGVFGE